MFRLLMCVGLAAWLSACDGGASVPSVASDVATGSSTSAAPVVSAAESSSHGHGNHSHDHAEAAPEESASDEPYVADKHYIVLSRPIPTEDPTKVEVAEFFWYGCGHCYAFEPSIKAYKESAPEYVNVVPVPTMWRSPMDMHAKAYYAMKNLKQPQLHGVLFEELRKNPRGLTDEKAIAQLFSEHGVEFEKAMKMLTSFGVSSQVRKAKSLAKGARISGTPTLVVNGKYVVGSSTAGSQANMLKIAAYLAEKERK